jgi:hypothetical protein
MDVDPPQPVTSLIPGRLEPGQDDRISRPEHTPTNNSYDELPLDTNDQNPTPWLTTGDEYRNNTNTEPGDTHLDTIPTKAPNRSSIWNRHQSAGFSHRDRVTSGYGLRQKVPRKAQD